MLFLYRYTGPTKMKKTEIKQSKMNDRIKFQECLKIQPYNEIKNIIGRLGIIMKYYF